MDRLIIHDRLEYQAETQPQSVAFRCMQHEISFLEFFQIVQKLAAYLTETASVEVGDRVGILMPRCIENAYAIYGILSAGGVYVPIDPSAPIDRINYIISDCQIKTIITVNSQRQLIAQLQEEKNVNLFVGIESDKANCISWEKVRKGLMLKEKVDVTPDDLAYILYTSGSTGQPKGIMHTHASGASFAQLCVDTFDLISEDVLANHAPIFFDISTLAFFAGPRCGAKTVLLSDMELMFPASVASFIRSNAVSVWYSVPLALVRMLDANAVQPNDFPSVRLILYAGEAFAPHQLKKWIDLVPHPTVYNLFGPTETNVCTVHKLALPVDGVTPVPIGKTWSDTHCLISGDESSSDDIGELWIASPTVMKGYWNQKEKSKNAFVFIESAEGISRKYYKTGDQVKRDKDGILHFTGRIDHQVKINGYRIELSEVETIIDSLEGVSESACWIRLNKDGNQELIATVVYSSKLTEEDIINHAKLRLPRYAIPHEVLKITKLPRTVRGKVNRSQLNHKK